MLQPKVIITSLAPGNNHKLGTRAHHSSVDASDILRAHVRLTCHRGLPQYGGNRDFSTRAVSQVGDVLRQEFKRVGNGLEVLYIEKSADAGEHVGHTEVGIADGQSIFRLEQAARLRSDSCAAARCWRAGGGCWKREAGEPNEQ